MKTPFGMAEFNVQGLPPELRRIIFDFLPVEDVRNCRVVCHQWNKEISSAKPLMRMIWSVVPPSKCIAQAEAGNLPFFKQMMLFAANKNPTDSKGRTPLHKAAQLGRVPIFRLLMANVEDKCPRDNLGSTPLHLAAEWPRCAAACCGVRCDVRDDVRCDRCEEIGGGVIQHGQVEVMRLLLEHNVDKDARDVAQRTPIHNAARSGHFEACCLLLQHQADKDARDRYGATPLHYTASTGEVEVCRLLLQHQADKEARDSYGETPLHKGARHGEADVCRVLLENEADKDARDHNGKTPLDATRELGLRLEEELETVKVFEEFSRKIKKDH